jgi:hypothetical protein
MPLSSIGPTEVCREAALLRQDLANEFQAKTDTPTGGLDVDHRPMDEVWASLTNQFGSRLEAERAVDQ